jgi:tricorn protease-like protein
MIGYFKNSYIAANKIFFTEGYSLFCIDLNKEETNRSSKIKGVALNNKYYYTELILHGYNFLSIAVNDNASQIGFLHRGDIYLYCIEGNNVSRITFFACISKIISFSEDSIEFASCHESPMLKYSSIYRLSVTSGKILKEQIGPANFVSQNEHCIAIRRGGYNAKIWKNYRGGNSGEIWVKKLKQETSQQANLENIINNDDDECFYKLQLKHNSILQEYFVSQSECDLNTGNVEECFAVGNRIYFSADFDGNRQIFSSDINGGNCQKHTCGKKAYYNLHIREKMAVCVSNGDLYQMNLDDDSKTFQHLIAQHKFVKFEQKKNIAASKYLQYASVSNDGNRVALITRGKLFSMSTYFSGALQIGDTNARYKDLTVLKNRIIAVADYGTRDVIEVHAARIDHFHIKHLELQSAKNDNASPVSEALNDIDIPDATLLPHETEKAGVANSENVQGNIVESVTEIATAVCSNSTKQHSQETISIKDLSQNTLLHEFSGDFGRITHMQAYEDRAIFSTHRNQLFFVDLSDKSGASIEIDKSEYGIIDDFDSHKNYIVYSIAISHQLSVIRLYNFLDGTKHDLTSGDFHDFSPKFSTDGKELYFLSRNNFAPEYGDIAFSMEFRDTVRPYAISLLEDERNPFDVSTHDEDHDEEEMAKTEHKMKGDNIKSDAESHASANEKDAILEIDFESIQSRIVPFPVKPSDYSELYCANDKVMWILSHEDKKCLECFSFATQKTDELITDICWIIPSSNSQWFIFLSHNIVRVIKAGEKADYTDNSYKAGGTVDLNRIKFSIDARKEWEFIFEEAVRLQKDFFWKQDMCAAIECSAVKYRPLIQKISTREDLNDIIGEFHGELHSSHAYVLNGGDIAPYKNNQGFLCSKFSFNQEHNAYQIEKMLHGDRGELPLSQFGADLRVGDLVVEIAGVRVSENISIGEMLNEHANVNVSITVADKNGENVRVINVKPAASEKSAMYRDWINENRAIVNSTSNNTIGYLHIPDMVEAGFAEFYRGYLKELNKNGLVLDLRFNGGGNVSTVILQKLAQTCLGFDKNRWNAQIKYPHDCPPAHLIVIANGYTGSDGDMFCQAFKSLKLGKIIGTRTWGGVVGIEPCFALIDGAMTSQPAYAFFCNNGEFIENKGVTPDIELDITPENYINGHDPQLAMAIKMLLQQIDSDHVNLSS